jgi:hypothetical protein
MSGLGQDKGMMAGKPDKRRKCLVHVCIRKELRDCDARTAIPRLETAILCSDDAETGITRGEMECEGWNALNV